MTENTNTPFTTRAGILADLWLEYRNDEAFADFIQYNDLGLPLAYCIETQIIESTPKAEQFINEAFDLFLAGLGVEDTGFDSLDQLLGTE